MNNGNGRIVIVTQEVDPHADQMVLELKKRGLKPVRFHTKDFPLKAGLALRPGLEDGEELHLRVGDERLAGSEIRSIWFRRPDLPALTPDLSKEEERMALGECQSTLFGFYRLTKAFWVNHPDKNKAANSKVAQLTLARQLGLRIPDTIITNEPEEARAFYEKHAGDVIFKVQRQAMWSEEKALSFFTSKVTPAQAAKFELIRQAPALLQEHVAKRVELRITVIGARIFPAALHSQDVEKAKIDWRKATGQIRHEKYVLPSSVEKALRRMVDRFGLQYAAIDMIVTPAGEHVFLEINPNGQFGWIDQLAGLPLYEAMADLLVAGKPDAKVLAAA